MPTEITLGTPLAMALHGEVASKLQEFGWAADPSDSTMTEYIVLMLVNGKTQDEITAELAGELLGLAPDDPDVIAFAQWLFQQIDFHSARLNGNAAQPEGTMPSQDDSTTMGDDQEMDMTSGNDGLADIDAPKGPKAMRNGNNMRGGGREKRMMGQINRTLDRSSDGALHRVRNLGGNSRIDSHSRGTPTGPRMGAGRQPRTNNNRAASLAHGLAAQANGMMGMPGFQGPVPPLGPGMNGNWMMGQPSPQAPDMVAMIEAQSRLLQQMSDQLQMTQQMNGRGGGFNRGGRLSDRVQRGRGGYQRGGRHNQHNGQGQSQSQGTESADASTEGGDVDMSGAPRASTNPADTVCRFNLNCTNKDCKFAHQSPAAPPGVSVDVTDVCSFGAACKNKKCVARHPSPASRLAHQSEQDCKFWPNCTNPRCTFRHPSMPPCRNGGDCATPDCKFTHVQTECKFNPCTNRYCTFKHAEGQRGTFQDKVWTAEGAKEHVSERKFADESAPVENVLPDQKDNAEMDTDVPIIT